MEVHDVNVFLRAFASDVPRHDLAAAVLTAAMSGPAPFGISTLALSGFLRIVTHPGSAKHPPDKVRALAFADAIIGSQNAVVLNSGPSHWRTFRALVGETGVHSKVIPDAYFAALAIEHGCDFVTFDRGFQRFPGLRLRLLE